MTVIEIIDRALAEYSGRQLVSTSEVTDLLLDVRGALTGAATYSPVVVGQTGGVLVAVKGS